jgi:hypothetical protein
MPDRTVGPSTTERPSPRRTGVGGLSLIGRSMKYELNREAATIWQPEGLTVTSTMPLDAVGRRRSAARPTR